MKKILWLAFAFLPTTALAGGTVGNPGDMVYCRRSELFASPGYYMFDYALGVGLGQHEERYARVGSWQDSARRIEQLLQKAFPETLAKYQNYLRQQPPKFGGPDGPGIDKEREATTYTWTGLTNITIPFQYADPSDFKTLPRECRHYRSFGDKKRFKVYRVAKREMLSRNHVLFVLDLTARGLLSESALQLSMLYIHEWLWDHTLHIQNNRQLNRFLHSSRAEELSGAELRRHLLRLGFRP